MGFIQDAKDTILKYGGILVQKTEIYTRIAKLNIEIQRLNGDINKVKQAVGSLVLQKISGGSPSMDLTDPALRDLEDKIKKFQDQIIEKRKEIESLKNEDAHGKGE